MYVRAVRHFVDSRGESHAIGEIFDMDDEEAQEYLGRTGYSQVIVASNEFEYQQQQGQQPAPAEEAPPTQTLADVVANNAIPALLRLIEMGHLDAKEVLEIEEAREEPRKSLIAELKKLIK